MNRPPSVLLGAYAAKQCARRTHNEWDSTIAAELVHAPPELLARFEQGRSFEARIQRDLLAQLGERALLVHPDVSRSVAIEQTRQAMADGRELIIGGWLPDDVPGGRKGRPDLLLCISQAGGQPMYVPGDVKAHRMTKAAKRGAVTYSTFDDPTRLQQARGRVVRTSDRYDDYVQLAHYVRMVQACGFAPENSSTGFIIGTDVDLGDEEEVLTWVDLTAQMFTTFSRTQGTAKRSAFARYDHEHQFRVQVAERAQERTGKPEDPPALVAPIITDECDVCPWRDYCRDELGQDAASAILETGRLDIREWRALAVLGILTSADLAALDLDDEAFWDTYLSEVTHQSRARARLATAVTRARMALAGVRLQRTTTGPIDLPRGDIEIDFDIEWDAENRVFLWGALLTDQDHPEGVYIHFSTLEPLDAESEYELGIRFLTWLRDQINRARRSDQTVAVFHYSHPEASHLIRVLGEDAVSDVLPVFVDLLNVVRAHYIGVAGLGIKQVAPEFGFHWRDADPGGLQAQAWLNQARTGSVRVKEEIGKRLLEYNEDDVRATAALRRGVTNVESV